MAVASFFPDLPDSLSAWWVLVTYGHQSAETCHPAIAHQQASTAGRYVRNMKAMFENMAKMAPSSPQVDRPQGSAGRDDDDAEGASQWERLSANMNKLVSNLQVLATSVDDLLSLARGGSQHLLPGYCYVSTVVFFPISHLHLCLHGFNEINVLITVQNFELTHLDLE